MSWHTIAKITGHKRIESLILHYDTIMEAQGRWFFFGFFGNNRFQISGFADVATAIATGAAVAQGQSPVKVKLANRQDRKRLSVVLDGEGSGQHNREVDSEDNQLGTLNESPTEDAQFAMNLLRDIVPVQQNLDLNYQVMVPLQENQEVNYQGSLPVQQGMDKTYQAMVPLQPNMVKNGPPRVPTQQNMAKNYQFIIEADIAEPTEAKRIDLRPSAEFPFCTTSQTMSLVSRGGPDTEKLTASMNAFGSMLGQLAKGLVEGAAPHIATMIKAFQVLIKSLFKDKAHPFVLGRFTQHCYPD